MSLSTLFTSAAFAPIDNVGWIRITGEDRVRWLNGMVTNSISSLKPGEGCYNFFLNAQGRIQGDATAWMMEGSILLETAAVRVPALMAMLDHFIIMDDVELADISKERTGVAIVGARAASLLDRFVTAEAANLPQSHSLKFSWTCHSDILMHADGPQVPRFEVWFDEPGDTHTLLRELKDATVLCADGQMMEQLRIVSGTPLYGVDIRDKELPQETGQTRALHFSKGCYLGQEIVERIRSRGNVHRTFSGFVLEGYLPAPGVVLTADEKPVGELTSVTRIQWPSGPVQIALGYIRREALERGAIIQYPGGTATPAKLPFSLPELRA